jgi:hypothetical protein
MQVIPGFERSRGEMGIPREPTRNFPLTAIVDTWEGKPSEHARAIASRIKKVCC